MDEFKKISEFSNKPTPVNDDMFLIQDASSGIYYNVTKYQLVAILGNQTLSQVLLIDNHTGGTPMISDNGHSQLTVNDTEASLAFDNGAIFGELKSDAVANRFTHDLLNYFDAYDNNFPNEVASQIAYLDASKNLKTLPVSSYPSLAELAFVKGVTSNIQDQLDAIPTTYTEITETFIVSGTTQNISFAPVGNYIFSLDGQLISLGYMLSSLTGTTATFNSDYTGKLFMAIYKH
jgi:hypothetical protein